MRLASISLWAAALVLAAPACTAAEEKSPAAPRAEMSRIFDAMVFLLPASLDEDRFVAPEEREAIRARIGELVAAADDLQAHSRGRDMGFGFLSRSLSSDIAEIQRRYDDGREEEARYYLHELAQVCVACHSRLPKAREYPLADRLLEDPNVAKLDLRERARLQVAVRRFGDAMTTWETLFADPAASPSDLDIGGDFVDYLTVAVRTERDLPRARKTLEKFNRRGDLQRYLRARVSSWIEALGELEARGLDQPTLANARKLVDKAHALSEFPGGRERLVYDLAASGVLHRYVDGAKKGDPSLAEAFYLLGVIEARTVDSYWVPQTEFHLEAAVRLDPKGPYAERAYNLLEEYIVLGYGGSSGVHVPPDVESRLAQLRGLIDGAAAAAD